MSTLIHGTTIVTGDAAETLHFDAAILLEGGRVAAMGPSAALRAAHPAARLVDGRGRLVMPGFANIHTHLHMTLARGVFEDLSPPHQPPFEGGLSPLPLPPVSAEENTVMVQLGLLEAIRCGTTALLEDAANNAWAAPAIAASGLRVCMAERAWDRQGGGIGDPTPFVRNQATGDAGLERIARLHSAWHGKAGGRITVGVSAWAPDMCSPELLMQLRAMQQKLDTICTIHLNQIWGEVAAVQAHRGMLPTEVLDSIGFLHDRLECAHCRCMQHSEEKLLGKARVNVSFNSAIAARRGLSPRVSVLKAEGCNIGMGSDNMAEDMVEVMRTGLFMERVRREDGRAPRPEEAFGWATRGGYAAMGVQDGGWLAVGNQADLIMVRADRAHMVPMLRPVSTWLHQGQPSDVTDVMVAGDWVMRDGRILTMDEDAIVAEAQRIGVRAWGKLFATRPDLEKPAGFVPV